jgi:hypothetical protein
MLRSNKSTTNRPPAPRCHYAARSPARWPMASRHARGHGLANNRSGERRNLPLRNRNPAAVRRRELNGVWAEGPATLARSRTLSAQPPSGEVSWSEPSTGITQRWEFSRRWPATSRLSTRGPVEAPPIGRRVRGPQLGGRRGVTRLLVSIPRSRTAFKPHLHLSAVG